MLFVTAMRREADAVSRASEPFLCGAGAAAYDAVAGRLAQSKPDGMILFGVCGGLDPSLGAGSLVLCRDVVLDGDGTILQPDRSLHDGARKLLRREGRAFVSSRLATLPRAVSSKSARTELWNEHGAGGADMETFHVARACAEARVPWIAVRAVLDPFGSRLPRAVRRWRSDADEARIRREALRSPLDWPDYIRLAWELRKATRALATAATDLVELEPGDIPLDLVMNPAAPS